MAKANIQFPLKLNTICVVLEKNFKKRLNSHNKAWSLQEKEAQND